MTEERTREVAFSDFVAAIVERRAVLVEEDTPGILRARLVKDGAVVDRPCPECGESNPREAYGDPERYTL